MSDSIAIIGNTALNIGIAMAGDLTLAENRVGFCIWPDQRDTLDAVLGEGGIHMDEPISETLSGRTGLAKPTYVGDDPAQAMEGAGLIVMDVAASEIEQRFAQVLPHLQDGQVVHVNTHGYWPALRLAGALKAAGKTGVTLTEGITPSMAAGRDGARVTPHALRDQVLVGAFPATRNDLAMAQLSRLFRRMEPAQNVLHTNLTSVNFLIHPAIALVNVGYFDRAEEAGEQISFYGTGNTRGAALLTEALDGERPAVCATFGVPCRGVCDQIGRLYGVEGNDLKDVVARAPFYRALPPLPAGVWKTWMDFDLPYAHVPFVRLAEQAGQAAPLHRGFVDIMDALTGNRSWDKGLTLEQLGLEGLSNGAIRQFVEIGFE
jgi:opine dehydrogenase